VFKSEKKAAEDYPFRVKTRPDRILDKDQFLDVKSYADKLEMTRARGEYWRLAFQGNLHKISEADYETISSDVNAAARLTAAR
jgi:predicted RNA-binding protein